MPKKGKSKPIQNATGSGSCVSERNQTKRPSLLAYSASLFQSHVRMMHLQRIFQCRIRVSFVRDLLNAMPFSLDQFNRLLLTGRGGITMMLVKRLVLYPSFAGVPLRGRQVIHAMLCMLSRFHCLHSTSSPLFSVIAHKSPVLCVGIHPTTGFLLTVCQSSTTETVNVSTLTTRTLQSPMKGGNMFAANSVASHPSAPYFVSGGQDKVLKIWSISSVNGVPAATCETSLICHNYSITCLVFNPDGEILATGGNNNLVQLLKLDFFKMCVTCSATLAGHTGPVLCLAFNLGGDILASGSQDGTIKLWDVKTFRCVNTLDGCGGAVNSIVFHRFVPAFATGHHDGTTKFWWLSDKSSATCMATLAGHTGPVLSLEFDQSGFFLVTASRDTTVRLWRLSANKLSATCVAILNGHNGPVNSVQFHQTKPILVTGSTDMRVIVYKL
jgi:WD40 repeat protein